MNSPFDDDTALALEGFNIASSLESPTIAPLYTEPPPIGDQVIPWNRTNITREAFRRERITELTLIERRRGILTYTGDDLHRPVCSQPPTYKFSSLGSSHYCSAYHYQLRHLVWSPTASSVFYTKEGTLMEWNPVTNCDYEHLNFNRLCGIYTRLTTICATERLLLAGGTSGELVIKRYDYPIEAGIHARNRNYNNYNDDEDDDYYSNYEENETYRDDPMLAIHHLTDNEDGSTNHIAPAHGASPYSFLISSNDAHVSIYNAQVDTVFPLIRVSQAVNASEMSPCGRLVAMASDSPIIEVLDVRCERIVMQLTGHLAANFSVSWHPDGYLLASGGEDHTSRIFDLRKMCNDAALHVLGAAMAAVRCVRFSHDGGCLGVMEECDFVTLWDTFKNFNDASTVEFFGEASGLDFSPDDEFCYVGFGGASQGGVIELKRPRAEAYLRISSFTQLII